ncbi:MAG: hypothetical protein FJ361_09785 [Gemmatimonadetes bacterium]|nr:hypothetical protein [Gemmatimonadota bacterium]
MTDITETVLVPGTEEHLRACAELLSADAITPTAVTAAAVALITRDLRDTPLRELAYDAVCAYADGDGDAYVSRR